MAQILISYRRADSEGITGRIYDRLVARYGADAVFRDVDDIPGGVDFSEHLRDTIGHADLVVAVIGPHWLGPRAAGSRIHDEGDPVRLEIEEALRAGVRIYPVLVGGAAMPQVADLPASLGRLPLLNAATIDAGVDFDHHTGRLIAAIDTLLGPKAPPLPPPPATPLIRRLRVYAAFAVVIALAGGAEAAGLAPPWPPGMWIATAVGAVAAVAAARALLRRAGSRGRFRTALAAAILVAVTATAYLFASSVYVYANPLTNERFAKGYVCTPQARLVYNDKCPALGLDELSGAEYTAERFWTMQSIAIVRIALDGLWVLTFLALSAFVAAASNDQSAMGVRS